MKGTEGLSRSGSSSRAAQDEKWREKWTQAVRLPGIGGGGGKLAGGPSS